MTTAQPPKRVLVITAHPDDADVHAGGTIARWADEGCEVDAVIATSGDKGHDDPMMTRDRIIALRRAEQRRAAAILGVQRVTFLDHEDGELALAGPRLAEDVTRAIREVRPSRPSGPGGGLGPASSNGWTPVSALTVS